MKKVPQYNKLSQIVTVIQTYQKPMKQYKLNTNKINTMEDKRTQGNGGVKKKEYMSHVYIKCPLLDFTGVIDFPVMYLVIWYLGVLCSVMSTSLQPFRL